MTRPLSKLQAEVLVWLNEEGDTVTRDIARIPTDLHRPSAIAQGLKLGKRLGLIQGGGGGAGRGSGHRTFNQAQRLISPLRGLEQRGLIESGWNDGPAYRLTEVGREVAGRL